MISGIPWKIPLRKASKYKYRTPIHNKTLLLFIVTLYIIRSLFPSAAEQKARSTYEYLIDLTDDPDVLAPLRFLREREIVHFQRFGEALDIVRHHLNSTHYFDFRKSWKTALDLRIIFIKNIAGILTNRKEFQRFYFLPDFFLQKPTIAVLLKK